MQNSFFSKINYSSSNEDSESERKALQITAEDVVLCVTGSGARSLDLLIDAPKQIVSIDFNSSQNHLLELKIAAFRLLSYREMLRFLGVENCDKRLHFFNKIKHELSEEAREFWEKNRLFIKNGVLFCGTWELLLRKMLKFSFFRKRIIRQLFAVKSIDEQKEIWDKKWNTWFWKFFLKLISNRFLWVNIIREPGAKLIPKELKVDQYLKNRLNHLAYNHLLKSNHYANLIFTGKYQSSCQLPHHLREENFEIIRSNLNKIEIKTASLDEFLSQNSNRFSKYSLSDFSSYAPNEIYSAIWKSIIYSAKNEAVFCERYFLVKKNPESLFKNLLRNNKLEHDLQNKDESAIYSFGVGKIINSN